MELSEIEMPKPTYSSFEWNDDKMKYLALVNDVIKDNSDFKEDSKSEEGWAAWKIRAEKLLRSGIDKDVIEKQINFLKLEDRSPIVKRYPRFREILEHLAEGK